MNPSSSKAAASRMRLTTHYDLLKAIGSSDDKLLQISIIGPDQNGSPSPRTEGVASQSDPSHHMHMQVCASSKKPSVTTSSKIKCPNVWTLTLDDCSKEGIGQYVLDGISTDRNGLRA
jgi:hypothetical protein